MINTENKQLTDAERVKMLHRALTRLTGAAILVEQEMLDEPKRTMLRNAIDKSLDVINKTA